MRLGDLIAIAPVVAALREKWPNAEIDILTYTKNSTGFSLLEKWVDHFICLDREALQTSIADPEQCIFEPVRRLQKILGRLKQKKYHKVINLTHTRASGHLVSSLDSAEKTGLSFLPSGIPTFGSPWMRQLNGQDHGQSRYRFHRLDLFHKSLELTSVQWNFTETSLGQQEASDVLVKISEPFILVQPLTSDTKKNWGVDRFTKLIKSFCQKNPERSVVILGAPFERQKLAPLIKNFKNSQLKVHLALTSLEGALSLLNRAEALVTGDTSIKHLAAGARCPVVELSIGSSDYQEFGVYKEASVVVQANVPCAPCPHSWPCTKSTHLCAEELKVTKVLTALQSLKASSQGSQIRVRKLHDGLHFYQTSDEPLEVAKTLMRLRLQESLIENRGLDHVGEYGSRSIAMIKDLTRILNISKYEAYSVLQKTISEFAPVEVSPCTPAKSFTERLQQQKHNQDVQLMNEIQQKFSGAILRTITPEVL